jgi:hypothetical protein
MWPRCESRSRRAAWYSKARFFRPSKVPRERHLRSRSRTLRTACRQAEQQKRAGLRTEFTGDSWQPGRPHNGGEKKRELRDHAPAQPLDCQRPETRAWHAGGALSQPGHGGPSRPHPHDVWLVAARLASGGPAAGIPGSGSSVGSNTAADRRVRIPCAGRREGAAGALWSDGGTFPYRRRRPREVPSPKGKLGENAPTFSPGAINTNLTLRASLRQAAGTRQRTRRR